MLTTGALAAGCGGASAPAPDAASPPAGTSAPVIEVAVEASEQPTAAPGDAQEPAPPKTVFPMNRPFKEDPRLVLTRVTKEPTGLRLDFVFNNKDSSTVTIKVSPPGDPNAMFVELPDGRRLANKSAEGISVKPNEDRVAPGEKQRFSLTFDPLPDGVSKFDVYEGAGAKNAAPGQSRFWFIRNIYLK
ncbi:MAG: hypothetical protein U0441_31325 [Polyangiaceae bacterium]